MGEDCRMDDEVQREIQYSLRASSPPPPGYPTEPEPDVFVTDPRQSPGDWEERRRDYLDWVSRNPAQEHLSSVFRELARLEAGGPAHLALFEAALDFVDRRLDCADFVLHGILRLLYQFGGDPQAPRRAARAGAAHGARVQVLARRAGAGLDVHMDREPSDSLRRRRTAGRAAVSRAALREFGRERAREVPGGAPPHPTLARPAVSHRLQRVALQRLLRRGHGGAALVGRLRRRRGDPHTRDHGARSPPPRPGAPRLQGGLRIDPRALLRDQQEVGAQREHHGRGQAPLRGRLLRLAGVHERGLLRALEAVPPACGPARHRLRPRRARLRGPPAHGDPHRGGGALGTRLPGPRGWDGLAQPGGLHPSSADRADHADVRCLRLVGERLLRPLPRRKEADRPACAARGPCASSRASSSGT